MYYHSEKEAIIVAFHVVMPRGGVKTRGNLTSITTMSNLKIETWSPSQSTFQRQLK